MNAKAIITAVAGAVVAIGAGAVVLLNGPSAPPVYSDPTPPTVDGKPCNPPGSDTGLWYVQAYQCARGLKAVSATVSIPERTPTMDEKCTDHVNSQITLIDDSGPVRKAIELGWVSYPQYGGPFLQVGKSVGPQDANKDYPSSEFVSVTNDPPQPLGKISPAGVPNISVSISNVAITATDRAALIASGTLDVKITHADAEGGEWQIWVGGKQVGYYPDKAFGDGGFYPTRAAWWGEVQTKPGCSGASDSGTCAAMGNGKPGSNVESVGFR